MLLIAFLYILCFGIVLLLIVQFVILQIIKFILYKNKIEYSNDIKPGARIISFIIALIIIGVPFVVYIKQF